MTSPRWAALLALLVIPLGTPAAETKKPNVIVVFSDDHGWADLGANGSRADVKTPHLDRLAKDGVRFTRGYVTAPQCVPSRAGLLTGRYQQRCGVDDNLLGPLPKEERTIAHAMADAGYRTGMVGKWHLDLKMGQPEAKGAARQVKRLPDHLPHKFGFQEMYCGELNNYHVTHDLDGKAVEGGVKLIQNNDYRVDVQTAAALSFIDRNAKQPFFLYVAYYAPHVPSEAPAKYLERFKDVKDEKRRVGLAMVSAVDDGVGEIRERLKKHGLDQDTLIVFIGDNGAPTKPNAWNGSLNDPLVGEKGMVTDGGIRVPFLAAWPAGLPKAAVYEKAVSSLDVLPTALAACGGKPKAEDKLDGVNLVPFLTGADKGTPHPQLFWRWRSQAAVLEENWKLVFNAPDRWMLFDTSKPEGEKGENDLAAKQPEKVAALKKQLLAWDATLKTPGLPKAQHPEDKAFFDQHVSPPELPKKPPIVVFLSDDHGQGDSTPYGAKDVRTPQMQRLAEAGCVFTHAFVASPSCAPSRSALLTGLMPSRNGAEANHSYKKDDVASLPEVLRKAGYQTAAFGKVAHGPKDVERHGFDHTDKDHSVKAVAAFLEKRDATKPLVLFVGTHQPHVPWAKNDGYDPKALTLPPTSVDTPAAREFRARYYTDITTADRELGETRALAKKHLGESCLFVYTSDHGAQWPFGKWNLYDAGIRVPLIVEWPGVVKPGRTSDAQVQWIDLLPTLIEAAGGLVPDKLDGRSFLGVLTGKTKTHRDRVFATHSGDGDLNVTPMRCLRKDGFKYILNLYPKHEYGTHIDRGPVPDRDGVPYWNSWVEAAKTDPKAAAVVKRYRERPAEELYDLTADPHEVNNIAADPKHADRLKGMRKELDEWMTEQGDSKKFFGKPTLLK